jgi:hypothetical protein
VDANQMLQSKYLNAADLKGRSVRVTIASVRKAMFRDGTSKLVLAFEGARKQLALNATNTRALIRLLGTAETDQWAGQRITLEPRKGEYAGQPVDCVRIAAPPEPPPARPAPPPASPPAVDGQWQASDADVPF